MQEFASSALSWLGDLLWTFFSMIAAFLMSFFPMADENVLGAIRAFGDAMCGGGFSTLNVFYFVDLPTVAMFAGMALVAIAAAFVVNAVQIVIDIVHKVMDSIPVVG